MPFRSLSRLCQIPGLGPCREPTAGFAHYDAMKLTDEPALLVLNQLLQVCRASASGFETAAGNATELELAKLFREFASQRRDFADAIHQRIRTLRSEPQDVASAGAALHRDWMELKATAAKSPSHALLEECERGEDVAVKAYGDALRQRDVDEITRRLVQEQYEQVQATHDRVRQLRDSPEYAHR
jgi:uncharacterized protein (TIGR02284 family)